MAHPLRGILNKILWNKRERPSDYEVAFTHRGAPNDLKKISASDIVAIGASWFAYSQEADTLIPFHRVVEVKNRMTGRVFWRSRTRIPQAGLRT